MNQISGIQVQEPECECPSCGSRNVSLSNEIEDFQYGEKETAVNLSVCVPVHHCASCGLTFTGAEAEEIRHDAVCRHLGVLTPRDVRTVREAYSLSQSQFSELTGIGKASLARWESGQLIQTQANDNFLYLMTFNENIQRLKDRCMKINEKPATISGKILPFRPKFRQIASCEIESLQSEANRFDLFSVVNG